MSKGKARFTEESLEAMGLEPDGKGGYRPKRKQVGNPDKQNKPLLDIVSDKLDFSEPRKVNMVWGEDGKAKAVDDPDGRWSIVSPHGPINNPEVYTGGIDPISDPEDTDQKVEVIARAIERYIEDDSESASELFLDELSSLVSVKEQEPQIREKVYVGVDPGKSGAIGFINPQGEFEKWIIPIMGKDIDANELYRIFNEITQKYSPVVILEDVHSLYGMSAASNFSFGFVCGMIRAMVIANFIPYHMVAPKTWQKLMWVNDDKVYKPKNPEQKNPSLDTKATSLKAATRIFPSYDFTKNARSRIAHDGIVDAVLLSEYGRRLNL